MNDLDYTKAKKRLEEIRKSLENENISYWELAELESLKKFIDKDDVQLREASGIPEFSKGGEIECRKLAKSKNFDIIVKEGRFQIELDKNGSGKYIVDSKGNRKDINKNNE